MLTRAYLSTRQGWVVIAGRNDKLKDRSHMRDELRWELLVGLVTMVVISSSAGSVPTYASASRKNVLDCISKPVTSNQVTSLNILTAFSHLEYTCSSVAAIVKGYIP